MLKPLADCFDRASAERLVEYRIDPDTQSRIDLLARKSNEGSLTDTERAECLDFVEAIDLIGILQSKARSLLVNRT